MRADGSLRYVEVKGRSGVRAIEMEANEWAQAANHRDRYWLYVVYHCDAVPQLLGRFPADDLCGPLERDVLVVAGLGLIGGREEGFVELVGHAVSLAQGNAADVTRRLVVLPPGADQIPFSLFSCSWHFRMF